jgi:hypothetical protein
MTASDQNEMRGAYSAHPEPARCREKGEEAKRQSLTVTRGTLCLMRRRVIIAVAICLFIGGMITLAIAWSCALFATFHGHWWSGVSAERVGDKVWSVRSADQGPIYMYISFWLSESEVADGFSLDGRDRPAEAIPNWVPVPRQKPGTSRFDSVTATGWPWPVMYFRRTEIGPAPGSNPATQGGLRISSTPRQYQLQYLPLMPVWPWFYLESAIIGGLLYSAAVLFRANLGLRRRMFGRCPKCGYDLRGDLKSGCPECGWKRE